MMTKKLMRENSRPDYIIDLTATSCKSSTIWPGLMSFGNMGVVHPGGPHYRLRGTWNRSLTTTAV